MKSMLYLTLLIICPVLTGCAGTTQTQQSFVAGGVLGPTGSAVIESIYGDNDFPAPAGEGGGTPGGYLYEKRKESEQKTYRQGYQQGYRQGYQQGQQGR
jgi:hypothetical protein